MNILHHKSWHVRNKRNIERVRRDEQKAREEEEAKEKRKTLAESEARIGLLRTKARAGNTNQKEIATLDQITSILGEEGPPAIGDDRRNLDHEVEAKKEKEEWEKKMGILTYLGQGLNDPGVEKPWYLMDHNERMKLEPEELKFDRQPASSSSTSNVPIQTKNDPLLDIQRYMDVIKQSKSKRETHQSDYPRVSILATSFIIPITIISSNFRSNLRRLKHHRELKKDLVNLAIRKGKRRKNQEKRKSIESTRSIKSIQNGKPLQMTRLQVLKVILIQK
jgi:hypothetical protein